MDDDHTPADPGASKGPWGAPRIAPPPLGSAPQPAPRPRRATRAFASVLSIAIFAAMIAQVAIPAYRDLSQPDAWAYWRDAYLSPSLKSRVAEVEIDGRTRLTLAVSGRIGAAAATWFRAALDDAKLAAGDVVSFSSPGGDLEQALIIGEIIRARGLLTAVASIDGAGRLEPSYCASACVLAFAGGAGRLGIAGSKLGVHRFTTKATGENAVADAQRTTGILLGYLTKMGVTPSVLELMTATSDIRWLSVQQALELKLVTQALPRS